MNRNNFFLIILIATLTMVACRKDKSESNEQDIVDIEVPTTEKQKSRSIAPEIANLSANFEVNEYFETFITQNKANNVEDIININKPKMGGELLRKADKVKLEISGYWANPSRKRNKKITLEVYPNTFKEGIDNRAIIEQKLKLTKDKRFLIFGYLKNVTLNEGLYYYFLKNGETVLYTGKFQVK